MLFRLWVIAFVVAGLTGCVTKRPEMTGSPVDERDVHIFLLAGQSNMAGRGEMSPDRRVPIPGVMALQRDGSWGPALDPLHWDKKVAGVGIARSFAKAYLELNPNVVVGFVPAACGGSPIESWVERYYYLPTKSYPMDDALARTKAVLWRGELKAVLWHQGEANAKPDSVPFYESNLRRVIDKFRIEFDSPDLPFLIGQLGEFEGNEWSESRRQIDQIHQVVAATEEKVGFVSSAGLRGKSDLVHFDAVALDEFGRRYAEVLAEMSVRE